MGDQIKTLGQSGGVDRNRVASMRVPWYVDTFADVWTVGSDPISGLPAVERSWAQMENGKWKVTVTHEGYADGTEPESIEETEQWSVDFDFSEEPIESHHNLDEIKKTYGGVIVDGKVSFPEKRPKGDQSKSGLSASSNKSGEKNPLFGVTTFILLKARISRSFSWREVPSDVGRQIGRIYQSIPGLPDDLANIDWGDRDWMVQPPKIQQKGDVWKVEQDYLLSPPGGWPPAVYNLIER